MELSGRVGILALGVDGVVLGGWIGSSAGSGCSGRKRDIFRQGLPGNGGRGVWSG